MGTYLLRRTSRLLGLLILSNLCWLTADSMNAEGGGVSRDTPAEAKFSCAIAKSAYGSPNFGEPVRRLRQFRDQVLMGSAFGRRIANAYYQLSGFLSPQLDGDGAAARSLRWTIRAFLYLVKYLEAVGLGAVTVIIALVLGRARAGKASPFVSQGRQRGS